MDTKAVLDKSIYYVYKMIFRENQLLETIILSKRVLTNKIETNLKRISIYTTCNLKCVYLLI